MTMRFFSTVVLFLFSLNAQAQLESWYSYWGMGLSSNDYPSNVETIISRLENSPGGERSTIGIDALGFYVPVSNYSMLGVVASISRDFVETNDEGVKISYTLNQFLYGVSGKTFFGREIGDGFFLRGDLGFATARETEEVTGQPDSGGSASGFGALFGLGYGIPISPQCRILMGITVSQHRLDGESFRTMRAIIGGLW